jgi:hypothetical protein
MDRSPWPAAAVVFIGALLVGLSVFFEYFPGPPSHCTMLLVSGLLMSLGLAVWRAAERGFWQTLGLVVAAVAFVEGLVCKLLQG